MVSPRTFTATGGRKAGKGKPWLQTEAALPNEMILTPQLLAKYSEKDRLKLMAILKSGDVSVADAIERIAADKAADRPAFMSAGEGVAQMAKLTPEVLAQFSETERLHLIELVKGGACAFCQPPSTGPPNSRYPSMDICACCPATGSKRSLRRSEIYRLDGEGGS